MSGFLKIEFKTTFVREIVYKSRLYEEKASYNKIIRS